jgi:hypothetical protein
MSIEQMQDLWHVLFPRNTVPSKEQFAIWLLRYSEYIVRQAIARAAIKFDRLNGEMTDEFLGKYTSTQMSRIMDEQKKKEAV